MKNPANKDEAASGKRLILIRHAKSDWSTPTLGDFDRPLNDRGKRDAPMMAARLRERKVKIDAIISSPAKRAKKTAMIFAKEYGIGKDDIIFEEDLYAAPSDVFGEVIRGLDDRFHSVALFSHNPGITDFANSLTETRIDNIPTTGVFAVTSEAVSWREFAAGPKEFWFSDFPKADLHGGAH